MNKVAGRSTLDGPATVAHKTQHSIPWHSGYLPEPSDDEGLHHGLGGPNPLNIWIGHHHGPAVGGVTQAAKTVFQPLSSVDVSIGEAGSHPIRLMLHSC